MQRLRGHSGHRKLQTQLDVINLAAVQRTRGLVVLRIHTEAVHIDVVVRHARVMFVGLHNTEVLRTAPIKAVHTIQTQNRRFQQVRGLNIRLAAVQRIGEVEPLVFFTAHPLLLHDPDELLAGMIEGQRNVDGVAPRCNGLCGGDLELVNEIFVLRRCEALALFLRQVDVVAEELHTGRRGRCRRRTTKGGLRG